MSRKWTNLPDAWFIDKHVYIGFPAFDPNMKAHIKEFGWVKVKGTWGAWLCGELGDDLRLRPDIKRGEMIYFTKNEIDNVLGYSR